MDSVLFFKGVSILQDLTPSNGHLLKAAIPGCRSPDGTTTLPPATDGSLGPRVFLLAEDGLLAHFSPSGATLTSVQGEESSFDRGLISFSAELLLPSGPFFPSSSKMEMHFENASH